MTNKELTNLYIEYDYIKERKLNIEETFKKEKFDVAKFEEAVYSEIEPAHLWIMRRKKKGESLKVLANTLNMRYSYIRVIHSKTKKHMELLCRMVRGLNN